jgi:hypothetical protein
MIEYLWLWIGFILYIIPIKVYYWGEPNEELYDDIFPEQKFIRWLASCICWWVKTILNFIMKIIKFLSDLHNMIKNE